MIARIRELTRTTTQLYEQLAELVKQIAPQLLAAPGLGVLIAAKLIGEIAGIDRFTSDAQLARSSGCALIPLDLRAGAPHAVGDQLGLEAVDEALGRRVADAAPALCEHGSGPGEDKKDFRIFDCCDNIAYFNQHIERSVGSVSESLRLRLFKERLTLILELAGAEGEGDGTMSAAGLQTDTAGLLRKQMSNMNVDNFLVRPHRQWVERDRAEEPWHDLDSERAIELADRVAGLPTSLRDDDEEAKRFDLIILQLQLCRLLGDPGQERLRR